MAVAKVFIVDDDSRVVRALGRALRTEGFVVETSNSAQQLFDNISYDEPACVLLDFLLPDVSGLEIQRRLKKDPTLPVIFLTGNGSVPVSVQAMKQGAFEFLLKPVDVTLLLDTVRRALAHSADALGQRQQQAQSRSLFAALTSRERQVASLVADGLLNRQIAATLGISEKTVKIHRGRVMHKLKIHSVPQLIRLLDLIADNDAN